MSPPDSGRADVHEDTRREVLAGRNPLLVLRFVGRFLLR
jgi:hypothetical protein